MKITKQIERKIIMFPQLSENTANTVYWLGWSLVLVSAMLGLAGSALGFWGDKERERYSDVRLSENEKETARANERAAILEKEAAVAKLELEKLRDKVRPREITQAQREQFAFLLKVIIYLTGPVLDSGRGRVRMGGCDDISNLPMPRTRL